VEKYIKAAASKSDIERQETNREKTGVFSGAYAINPVNYKKVPIWIADYVLYGYGTGAIMAVPAHDKRDYDFAEKFDLPIVDVIAPELSGTGINRHRDDVETLERRVVAAILCNDKGEYLLLVEPDNTHFLGGDVELSDADDVAALKRQVTEESGYTDFASIKPVSSTIVMEGYRIPKGKNQRTEGVFYEVVLASDKRVASEVEEGKHEIKWVPKSEVAKQLTFEHHSLAWEQYVTGNRCYEGEGDLVNSGTYDGLSAAEARDKIIADLETKGFAKERVNYKIRDWLISRQRYWGAPIPIIHCSKDGAVAVPEDQLPVLLPEITDYEPSGDGRSPLAKIAEFINTDCPKCGGPAKRETDTMDGFACSSWYFLRFADPHNNSKPFDKDKADLWLPVDDYIGGAEHAVMHLLYARFWTKVMFDQGLIDFKEPFSALRNQGMILAPDGQKMSKSRGNTIEPDGLIEQGYGADSVRIMELFIGPWNQAVNWSVEGMAGAYRFLQRFWNLTQEFLEAKEEQTDKHNQEVSRELNRITHRTIKKVGDDLNALSYNTAIASQMEMINDLYKQKTLDLFADREAWEFSINSLLQLLAPFAPHISEELWHQMGNTTSIHLSQWPAVDEQYLKLDQMSIAIQINGKLRGEIKVNAAASEETVVEAAKAEEKVAALLTGHEIKKTIYVSQHLVNFVI
jgi:leucyl-tRNA synthetase